MHGASLVEVRYGGTTPPLTDMDAPQAVQEPGQTARVRDYARGDADAALRGAAVVSDLQCSIARNNTTRWNFPRPSPAGTATGSPCGTKVQGIPWSLEAYSKAFGIPTHSIRVISPFVGGAFGSAGKTWPNSLLAAFTARQMRRPVKLVLNRKQFYGVVGFRATSRQRLVIGADGSGRISAIVHEGRTENRVTNATRKTWWARRDSCTPRPTCDRCIAVCRWTSTLRHTCAGLAQPPARLRWSAVWMIWQFGWASIRSSCVCATNPTLIDPRTSRSPADGSPNVSGTAPPRSVGRAETQRRGRPATATS